MPKHLLLTVSEQRSAFYSLRFMDHFFSSKKDFWITLFFDASKAHYKYPDKGKSQSQNFQAVLNEAKEFLVQCGFDGDMVDTKTKLQQLSKAMDIIREGQKGSYDAIVLGKRSISRLEEFFERSTTKEVLEKEIDFPLWICRQPIEASRNILLCLDGSQASFRMANHVGYIMNQQLDQDITLFRTLESSQARKKDQILDQGQEILLNQGIANDRIAIQTKVSDNPARAIMDKVRQDRYAVTAVGLTGKGLGSIKKVFLGSTSKHLFRELTDCTLWVCK